MLPSRDSWITRGVLTLFFLAIIIYAYFEARGILFGPSIEISRQQQIAQVTNSYIEITGTTTHIANLEMNGQVVPVTEAGAFDVPYVLSPGENRIVLDAKDKYGHTTEKVLQIVYTPPATSSEASATTTSATATSTAATSSVPSGASTTPMTP